MVKRSYTHTEKNALNLMTLIIMNYNDLLIYLFHRSRLEHAMKVIERVFDNRIQQQANTHIGYMPGKGTTDVIFVVKQLHEKYRAKDRKVI